VISNAGKTTDRLAADIRWLRRGDRLIAVSAASGRWASGAKSDAALLAEEASSPVVDCVPNSSDPSVLIAPIRNGGCNLLCRYCYVMPEQPRTLKLSLDEHNLYIRKLLEFAGEREIVIVFIGGEPILNFPVIRQVVEYWRGPSEKIGAIGAERLRFGLFSNLTLITRDIAQWIRQHGVLVSTSLDGPEDIHDAFRQDRAGKGSFGATMRGLEMLRGQGVDVGVVTTVTDPDRVLDIFEFLAAIGIRRTNIRHMRKQMNHAGRDPFPCGREYQRKMAESSLALADHIASKNEAEGTNYCDFSIGVRLLHLVLPSKPYMCLSSPCGAGSGRKIGLDCDGGIYPCDTMAGMKGLQVGHLRDLKVGRTLAELLHNSEVISRVRRRRVENLNKCNACTWRKHCGGGCTAVSYSLYGELDREGDRCAYERTIFEGLLWRIVENPQKFRLLTRGLSATATDFLVGKAM
jgi:uncharacterized protein